MFLPWKAAFSFLPSKQVVFSFLIPCLSPPCSCSLTLLFLLQPHRAKRNLKSGKKELKSGKTISSLYYLQTGFPAGITRCFSALGTTDACPEIRGELLVPLQLGVLSPARGAGCRQGREHRVPRSSPSFHPPEQRRVLPAEDKPCSFSACCTL